MKTYNANCHCGAIKLRIHVPEIATTKVCNCSMCYMKGYCFVSVPMKDDFELLQGDDMLETYVFGGKKILHKVSKFALALFQDEGWPQLQDVSQ